MQKYLYRVKILSSRSLNEKLIVGALVDRGGGWLLEGEN